MQSGADRIFASWIAGEDNIIDRHDFERMDLLFKDGAQKNNLDLDKFNGKIDEFYNIAKSTGLPDDQWEPRTIHFEENAQAREQIINVRESKVRGQYELDNTGDGIPNTKPNGEALRLSEEDTKKLFSPQDEENDASPNKTTGDDETVKKEKESATSDIIGKMKKVHSDELSKLGLEFNDGLSDVEKEILKDYYNFYVLETKKDPLRYKPYIDSLDQILKDNNLDPKEFQPRI